MSNNIHQSSRTGGVIHNWFDTHFQSSSEADTFLTAAVFVIAIAAAVLCFFVLKKILYRPAAKPQRRYSKKTPGNQGYTFKELEEKLDKYGGKQQTEAAEFPGAEEAAAEAEENSSLSLETPGGINKCIKSFLENTRDI